MRRRWAFRDPCAFELDTQRAARPVGADSIDTLRDYLDPAIAGVSENTYFEIDKERATRLPAAAAGGA